MTKCRTLVLCLLACFATASVVSAQQGPVILQPVFQGESPPLTDLLADLASNMTARDHAGTAEFYDIPNQEVDLLQGKAAAEFASGEDPVRQSSVWRKSQPTGSLSLPELSFEGNTNADNAALLGVLPAPPDVEGDVGKDYYAQMNNVVSEIFHKSDGSSASGPFPNNIFFAGTGSFCEATNSGDPIVLYDHEDQRWIFSQFAIFDPDGKSYQCFAVSKTRDPLGAYYLYQYEVATPIQAGGAALNDYEKITVWHDGLYYTHNEFQFGPTSGIGVAAIAFDKDAMYDGESDAVAVKFSLTPDATGFPFYLLPSHWEGNKKPKNGAPNIFFQAVDRPIFGGPGVGDGFRQWAFSADFENPANSTFTELPFIETPDFNLVIPCGRNCFDQPSPGTVAEGNGLDDIGLRAMFRVQWRSFGRYDSALLNMTVNADGNGLGGVRWTELRDYGNGFELYQTGTFAPSDGNHRFMGSIAQDRKGNIALGYSVTGLNTFPSIRYTGRTPDDPLGTMQSEIECHAGTGSQIGAGNRWGDYSTMSVDPQDDCTFWYTQEYYDATIVRDWKTRVCSFRFDTCRSGSNPGQN